MTSTAPERDAHGGPTYACPTCGAQTPISDYGQGAAARLPLIAAVDDARRWLTRQLPDSWAPAYFAQRHLDVPSSAGFAPRGWTGLTDHLRALGYSDTTIRDAGLAISTQRGTLVDRFRDRVTLAVHDSDGDVVGFVARKHPDNTDERAPRYVNTPRTELYRKGELLYGLLDNRPALLAGATPVIAEGAFDALAVTQSGSGDFVGLAPCGTALTAAQLAGLCSTLGTSYAERPVLLAFDGDDAGRQASAKAAALCTASGLRSVPVRLDDGTDPASAHLAGTLSTRLTRTLSRS